MNLATTLQERLDPTLFAISKDVGALADHHRLGAVMVGGVVRDILLARPITEVDFMAESPARLIVDELAKKYAATITFHEAFQTFAVVFPSGLKVDVTTARREIYEASAKLPKVTTSPTIKVEDDLIRRDFTINAMALWLNKGRWGDLLDPFDGLGDLKNKLIRILHDKSFVDDPTRLFRAARFAGRYSYQIEAKTLELIMACLKNGTPKLLSPVRRRHEFEMILKEIDPRPALRLLIHWSALPIVQKDWTLAPEDLNEVVFPEYDGTEAAFVERLKTWFSQWSRERADLMMTELAFEKKIKRQVLLDTD